MSKPKEGSGVEREVFGKTVSAWFRNGYVWLDADAIYGMTIAEANARARCILLLTGGDYKKPEKKKR